MVWEFWQNAVVEVAHLCSMMTGATGGVTDRVAGMAHVAEVAHLVLWF